MRKGHVVYAFDKAWLPGKSLGSPHAPEYQILESYPAPDAARGFSLRFVATFDKESDRDNILKAMQLGGYCTHNKKSWVRSIWGKKVK